MTRVTVNLRNRATADLQVLGEATGLNMTDLIDRAIRVYALLREPLEEGQVLIDRPDGRERVYIV